ncbi:hypothetical protein CYMTET_30335, partial [Cymbomonas tetramitiformis]
RMSMLNISPAQPGDLADAAASVRDSRRLSLRLPASPRLGVEATGATPPLPLPREGMSELGSPTAGSEEAAGVMAEDCLHTAFDLEDGTLEFELKMTENLGSDLKIGKRRVEECIVRVKKALVIMPARDARKRRVWLMSLKDQLVQLSDHLSRLLHLERLLEWRTIHAELQQIIGAAPVTNANLPMIVSFLGKNFGRLAKQSRKMRVHIVQLFLLQTRGDIMQDYYVCMLRWCHYTQACNWLAQSWLHAMVTNERSMLRKGLRGFVEARACRIKETALVQPLQERIRLRVVGSKWRSWRSLFHSRTFAYSMQNTSSSATMAMRPESATEESRSTAGSEPGALEERMAGSLRGEPERMLRAAGGVSVLILWREVAPGSPAPTPPPRSALCSAPHGSCSPGVDCVPS